MHKDDIQDVSTPAQIKNLLQQSILRNYPNPERKGCLDSSVITEVGQQRLPHEDSRWEHISHCSECYREFLDCRKQFRENNARAGQARQRMRLLTLLVAVTAIGLLAMAILKSR
jgi:hypothetical protein